MSSDGTDHCSNCGDEFGYEIGWDDPPEGAGYIEVTYNPEDESSFVVGETRRYCSTECLIDGIEDCPFSGVENRSADSGGEQ